jgi:DNA-binding MarR family transcriptional regulator
MVSRRKATIDEAGRTGGKARPVLSTKAAKASPAGGRRRAQATETPAAEPESRGIDTGSGLAQRLESLNEAHRDDLPHHSSHVDELIRLWQSELPERCLDAFEIALRVRRLAMAQDELLARTCESLGVKPNEMLLMFALRRGGPPYSMRPMDILRETAVTSGTVTYRIDQLVKQNLAQRVQDPVDRRGFLVQLTPNGKVLTDKALSISTNSAEHALAPLNDVASSMEVFRELLKFYEYGLRKEIGQAASLEGS